MPIYIVGKVRALLEWADELILGGWMERCKWMLLRLL